QPSAAQATSRSDTPPLMPGVPVRVAPSILVELSIGPAKRQVAENTHRSHGQLGAAPSVSGASSTTPAATRADSTTYASLKASTPTRQASLAGSAPPTAWMSKVPLATTTVGSHDGHRSVGAGPSPPVVVSPVVVLLFVVLPLSPPSSQAREAARAARRTLR